MLLSTIKSNDIKNKILKIANNRFKGYRCQAFYEHGQWWLKVENDHIEYLFDVIDVVNDYNDNEIDFELIDENEIDFELLDGTYVGGVDHEGWA